MKFIKKPVEIEAIQWDGANLKELLDFVGKHPEFDDWFSDFKSYEAYVKANNNIFKIVTLEGNMEASVGDWIIKGVKGEFYPCKPDIFDLTYDKVSN